MFDDSLVSTKTWKYISYPVFISCEKGDRERCWHISTSHLLTWWGRRRHYWQGRSSSSAEKCQHWSLAQAQEALFVSHWCEQWGGITAGVILVDGWVNKACYFYKGGCCLHLVFHSRSPWLWHFPSAAITNLNYRGGRWKHVFNPVLR